MKEHTDLVGCCKDGPLDGHAEDCKFRPYGKKGAIDLPQFTKTHRKTCHGRCPTCQLLDRIETLDEKLNAFDGCPSWDELNSYQAETMANLIAAEKERDALRAAFERYAVHDYPCKGQNSDRPCTCGFRTAISKEGS